MSFAIVDDRDERITYTGTWTRDGIAEEYLRTTTASVVVGSSWSLDFEGTSVTVVGTRDNEATRISYAIDGGTPLLIAVPAPGGALLHQRLFTSPTLQDGQHRLVVTMQGNLTRNSVFFDYALVGLGKTVPEGTVLFVDDANPAIQFNDAWQSGASSRAFGNTLHIRSPSTASFSHTFTGTGVSVIGVLGNGTAPATGRFVLDGTAVPVEAARNADGVTFNTRLFDATDLKPVEHVLTFEATSPSIDIDYVLVDAVPVNPAVGSSAPGTTSVTPVTGVPTFNGANTPSVPATTAGSVASPGPTSAGMRSVSMGGAVGPLALFATVLFYLKKKF